MENIHIISSKDKEKRMRYYNKVVDVNKKIIRLEYDIAGDSSFIKIDTKRINSKEYEKLISILNSDEIETVCLSVCNFKGFDLVYNEILGKIDNVEIFILCNELTYNEYYLLENSSFVYLDEKVSVNCVVMASGFSTRYKDNKLLATINDVTLFEISIKQIPIELFKSIIVVTRYPEIVELAKKYSIRTVLHKEIYNSDTLRIGLQNLPFAYGCMFMTCDQPLRKRESLINLVEKFSLNPDKIIRFSYQQEKSNPVIFPVKYYQKIINLEKDMTARSIIDKNVVYVQALNHMELYDVDTKEDYQKIIELIEKK